LHVMVFIDLKVLSSGALAKCYRLVCNGDITSDDSAVPWGGLVLNAGDPGTAKSSIDRAAPALNKRRTNSLVAGAFYLLTFVSIPTLALYAPARDPNFIVGPGPDGGILIGAILEIVVALAGIGTAVTLFPVVKRQHEGVALGFVGSRVVEGGAIFVGAACLLTLVSLRQARVGSEALVTGRALLGM